MCSALKPPAFWRKARAIPDSYHETSVVLMTSYGFVLGRHEDADYRGARGRVTTSYVPPHIRRISLGILTWSGCSDLHDGLALLRPQTTLTHLALLRLLVFGGEGRSNKDVALLGVPPHPFHL